MQAAGTSGRFGIVLVVAMLLAGCAGQMPSLTPSAAAPAAPAAPTAASLPSAASSAATSQAAVCPPARGGASPLPATSPGWPGLNPPAGLSQAGDVLSRELVAAIGNPDTGSTSDAWAAFEGSLGSGDAATIRARSETVTGHLRAACAAVAPYLDEPGAQAWAADVRGLLDGTAAVVAAMRDGAIGHDTAAVEAARARMQAVLLDHFYQSFKMSNPEAYRYHLEGTQSATASHVRWSADVGKAFDGDATTVWLAGDVAAPQWIELDLGWDATITGIRLLGYQEAAGATDHLVTVRSSTGQERELVRFRGDTRDGQLLEYTAPAPVEGVRYVRVATLVTPSMIGWREMTVGLAEASTPGPCPASTTPVTAVARMSSDPSTGASDPTLAVDGDQSTGWDPGPIRGVDGARGWIRVWYASGVRISEVRVLLGPGSTAARYEVLVFPPGELGTRLGVLSPIPAAGGWVSLPGPNPCLPYESVYLFVRSEQPAGLIREILVIGTAAP